MDFPNVIAHLILNINMSVGSYYLFDYKTTDPLAWFTLLMIAKFTEKAEIILPDCLILGSLYEIIVESIRFCRNVFLAIFLTRIQCDIILYLHTSLIGHPKSYDM